MVTSLKTDFAQIISRCPKNLSCPKFGGAAAPLAPPARTPMFGCVRLNHECLQLAGQRELACKQTFYFSFRSFKNIGPCVLYFITRVRRTLKRKQRVCEQAKREQQGLTLKKLHAKTGSQTILENINTSLFSYCFIHPQ